jgi:hypothetical protein
VVQVDERLSFLDGFVAHALVDGCAAYVPPHQRRLATSNAHQADTKAGMGALLIIKSGEKKEKKNVNVIMSSPNGYFL